MAREVGVSESRVNQKMLDAIAYEVKIHKQLLLESKEEAELAKNWDFKKALLERIEDQKRYDAEEAEMRKQGKTTSQQHMVDITTERVFAWRAARRQGKPIQDRRVFNQAIDYYSSPLLIDQYKTFVKVHDTDDDACASVADKITKTHFFK